MDVAVRTINLRKTYLSRGRRRVAVQGLVDDGAARRRPRLPRPQRVGQDDDDPDAARARAARLRHRGGCSGRRCHDTCRRSSTGSAPSSRRRSSSPPSPAARTSRLLADAIGTPRHRVDEVLEATHLGDRGRDRFAGYSLGMKQRLAIAATLLKDPDLLIFDEPTNGLDPAGIREVRDTMRSLGAQGKTVLVSSHLLSEVEQVADTVSIIGHGSLLAEGRVSDILGEHVHRPGAGGCRVPRERRHDPRG